MTSHTAGLLGSGWSVAKQAFDKQAEQAKANARTFRFLLKPNESARIVILEDEPAAVVEEHFIRTDRPRNIVCPGDGCPLCASGNKKSLVAYFTILHLTKIEREGGDPIVNPIRMLGAKSFTAEYLIRQHEKRGGLQGCVFDVERSTRKQAASVGDIWEFVEKISKADIKKLNPEAKPLNFQEELEFLSVSEISKISMDGAKAAEQEDAPAQEVEW